MREPQIQAGTAESRELVKMSTSGVKIGAAPRNCIRIKGPQEKSGPVFPLPVPETNRRCVDVKRGQERQVSDRRWETGLKAICFLFPDFSVYPGRGMD